MRLSTIAAVIAVSVFAVPATAAETCAAKLSKNNPAFGEPRPCPSGPAKPVGEKPGAKPPAMKVTKENGKTVLSDGDTSIAIGGSIRYDVTTGKGQLRP